MEKLRSFAAVDLQAEAKAAKNYLKNAMSSPVLFRLIAYEQIGRTQEGLVLQTKNGQNILLGDLPGMEETIHRISMLPDERIFKDQVLLGGFYYSPNDRRLRLKPLSILTESDVIRLLY